MSIFQNITRNFLLISRITRFYNASFCCQIHSCSNSDTIVSALISSLASSTLINHCRMIHCRVFKHLSYNHGFIGDQIVSAYVRLGYTKDAYNLFDELPVKDLVSWNSLISGFSANVDLANCLNVFLRMKYNASLNPNEVTFIPLISAFIIAGSIELGKYIHGCVMKLGLLLEVKVCNALINFYGKCGCLDAAFRIFMEMPLKNLVSWNSIIAVQVQTGYAMDGLRYFILMRRAEVVSDQATLLMLIQACEKVGLRKLADAIHCYGFRCGLKLNLAVATALLKLYSNLGILSDSRKIFAEILKPDAVAWTAMLACYAMHGCGREAVQFFEVMVREGVAPDHVTFTHLLTACSHSGLVIEGKYYFKIMSEVYGVEPRVDHYSCMVDLFGRSGLLNDAYKLIKSMPIEPNSAVWGALIGACRIYGNIELGKEAAENLFALDPSDSRNYIVLSNMYSSAGHWRDASKVRTLMKNNNLVRNPGCSLIEHENRIRCFVMGDHSHPETEQIYKKLEELMGKIRKAGYIPKTEFVLHDVGEDVKEDVISKHSEKLAIAFGILVTNANVPLVITKNLRICGDCHDAAKYISMIERRTIIIRDTKRFHHFSNGACSCGDYW